MTLPAGLNGYAGVANGEGDGPGDNFGFLAAGTENPVCGGGEVTPVCCRGGEFCAGENTLWGMCGCG